ncbi:hypothetical protein [Ereboglobus luteus]|uniref:hypothetical protein n=1 Tax=Ereboglobus luteus TaxID=1796921 RepID=UPI001F1BF40F|nr:hypothetical protein [Ereboglobus luteus]
MMQFRANPSARDDAVPPLLYYFAENPEHNEQDDRADHGINDKIDERGNDILNFENVGKKPCADERANDTDNDIADNAESEAAHDNARKPSDKRADYDEDDERSGVHEFASKQGSPIKSSGTAPYCTPTAGISPVEIRAEMTFKNLLCRPKISKPETFCFRFANQPVASRVSS